MNSSSTSTRNGPQETKRPPKKSKRDRFAESNPGWRERSERFDKKDTASMTLTEKERLRQDKLAEKAVRYKELVSRQTKSEETRPRPRPKGLQGRSP